MNRFSEDGPALTLAETWESPTFAALPRDGLPMPRPRTPVELLQLAGSYRPNWHAQRRAAPKSTEPVGDPPPHLAEDEAAVWHEFVRDAVPGVLTGYDRWALEALARLVARSRRQGLTSAELGHLRGSARVGHFARLRGHRALKD